MFSGGASADDLARLMLAGADDFLQKPVGVLALRARVKAAIRLKDAEHSSDQLHEQFRAEHQELEARLGAKTTDLAGTRDALVLALARRYGSQDGSVPISLALAPST